MMAKLVRGDRVGRLGKVSVGCAAVIFDAPRQKVLLTRRADNGRWCLPGGQLEAGESAAEACAREVQEETGLCVRTGKLVGVYTDPHLLIEYPDGNRIHLVSLCFEADVLDGQLGLSDETTDFGYFTRNEIEHMDVMEHHRARIIDAFAGQVAAFVR